MVALWSFLARPVLAVDESKRMQHLELLQEDRPGGEPQLMIKTVRYLTICMGRGKSSRACSRYAIHLGREHYHDYVGHRMLSIRVYEDATYDR